MQRALSQSFINDLKANGKLYSIVERVKKDDTLMLAIRKDYINIYYRGGNLLRIKEQLPSRCYNTFFDPEYDKTGMSLPTFPRKIENQEDAIRCVNALPHLKEIMDLYFSAKNKSEREFQQLVARENNFSMISNESEYFITDIEFADNEIGAKFDIIGIQWLADHRRNGSKCLPALIEMKYGDGALDGTAGLIKHLGDIYSLVSNRESYSKLLSTMESQFNQLDGLGLLKYNHATNETQVKLNPDDKPEVIILLANHNPRSTKLKNIIDAIEIEKYEESFDLKFFVSSFAGYGMHSKSMLSLAQFRYLLKA